MKKLLMIVMALAATAAFGESAAFARATGASMRLDTRQGVRIAAMGASETIAYSPRWARDGGVRGAPALPACTVTADGATLKTASEEGEVEWSPTSTGAHVLTHLAGDVTYTAQFTVLGDDVAQHAGAFAASETWSSNQVHLVTADVTVPSGKTLTIEPGAVVKFMTGTSLTVNGTCMAYGVIFTHVNDDTVGGDTLMDGDAAKPVVDGYKLSGNIYEDDATERRYETPQTLTSSISGTVRLKGHKVYLANSSITVNSRATLTLLPGAIIKFASGCSMTVNGTLDAQGTRAAPIVFTSAKDDEWGGDTNGDGEKTRPEGGNWTGLYVNGTANLAYCYAMYAAPSNERGNIECKSGGRLTMDGCTVAHSLYDGVWNWDGTIKITNSIFFDCGNAVCPYQGSTECDNCVMFECNYGYMDWSHWVGGTFKNCIFYGMGMNWSDTQGASEFQSHSTVKNCCFYNPEGYSKRSCTKDGIDGCLYADPKFIDPDNGDFRIAADSPCVDAGDGTVAPELDYWGQPRMDAKGKNATGVPNADGVCPDIGIYEFPGKVTIPVADLAVLSVSAPATAVPGEEIALTYVVTNRGGTNAVGMVRDRFQLKGADAALGGQAVAAGEVQQLYSLAAGAVATFTARVKCPTVKSGNWTVGVTVNAERDVFEQVTANNTGWAGEPTTVELEALAAGESRVSVAAGAASGFVLGEGVRTLRVASDAALDNIGVYGAIGAVPVSAEGGVAAVRLGDGSWLLVLPEAAADEKGYVVIENGGSAAVELKVTAEAEKLAVLGVAPSRVAAVDGVSVTITGMGLSEGLAITLGGRTATHVTKVNAAQVVATFNLAGMAAGASEVVVSDGAGRAALPVEVYKTTQGPKLEAKLELPSSVRDGRIYTAWIEYANVGDEPMTAPIFTVKRADSATKLKILISDDFTTEPLHIVGIGSGYPAGVLAAGDSGRIPFYFMPSGTYRLELSHAKDETATTKYKQFADTVDYRQAVADAATRLSARGKAEYRVRECVNFALAERADRDVAAISGTVLDATTREPLSGVTVSAVMTNDATRTASCTADADGHFSLVLLSDGDWRLSVDGGVVSGGDVVTISGQKDVNGHVLTARLLATVSGTVLTADTYEPIVGAAVRLHLNNGELPSDETTTDASGAFKLEGVVSGTYALVVNSKDGYVGDVVTNVVLSLGGSYAAGVFELSKGAVLYGTVTKGGDIVTNGTVYACFEDGSAARAMCSTNGTYCFDGLPPYGYRVRYAGDGVQADFVDVTLGAGETKELDLVAKATPLFFPIRPRGYGSLTTQFMVADPVLATNATAFAWDFDNDGSVDSTDEEPEWTYDAVGSYSVKLVATTPQGAKTSLYENCVTVEEAIENTLNANAFRVDETAGIDCTALGENTLTLVGTPPMTLAMGVVVGGKFGDEWYIRRVTGVKQSGTTYTLTTEEATLDDLYASYCFTSCQEVELAEDSPKPLLQAANANSTKSKMRLMAKSKKPNESVKVVGGMGVKFSGSCSPRVYVLCEQTRKDGYSYSCIGLAGEVSLAFTAELFGELGLQYNVPLPLSIDIPTPVPFVEVSPKLEFGINIGASGKASGSIGVSACPRVKVALENKNNGGWHFANPWDGFNFNYSCYDVEFSGKAGFELYAKAGGDVKAFKVMNVGIEKKFSVGAELSGGTKSASKFEVKYASTISAEANAFDASNIPGIGKWLDFKVGVSAEWESGSLVLASIKSPEPDFVMSPDHGDAPLAVQFRDNAKSGEISVNLALVKGVGVGGTVTHQPPTAWAWDLYFEKSALQSPSYTYYADGEYEISQKVKGVFLHPGYAARQTLYVGKEKPPEDEQQKDDQGGDTSKQSWDPNEMAGPLGAGDPETERFVKPGEWMDYTIYFENKADADVPAQEVFVDAQLSEWLDWSTFEMGEIAFNNQNETVLAGLKNGMKTVAQNGADYKVQLSVTFDEKTGAAHWYLRSYDPSQFDYNYWPAAVDAGFLPPNDETHRGEGHITYRVKVRDDAPKGVKIDAAATIVFDQNEPIPTDPAWFNTVGDVRQLALSLGDGTTTNLTLVVGHPFGELPVPAARTGHDFAGWYLTERGDDEPVKAETIVPAELETLYPRWTPQQFAVDADGAVSQHAYGTTVDLTTPASATNGYTNVVCVGWVGTGDVPAAGTSNAVTFTVTRESALRWLYETNYWVSATADAGGRVALKDTTGAALATNEVWASAGTNLTAEATADEGYAFARWVDAETGAECGALGELALPVIRPWLVRAQFTNLVLDVHSDCSFAEREIKADEGAAIELAVSGGNAEEASSVGVYLTYQTAAAADIDLKTATVDGETPKGGVKFPLTLSWAAGEVTNRVIRIPVKADKAVENDETLVFQLAAAQGLELGEPSECKVTIHDPGYDALKAKVDGGTATKAEKSAWDKLQKNAGVPYVAGLAEQADRGKVTGGGYCAEGKKVTLKAKANMGFVFSGWYDGEGAVVTQTASLVIDRSAKPAKDSETSTTIAGITSDVTYYAAFVTSAEDAASITAGVNGMTLSGTSGETPLPRCATNVWAGVYLEWPVAASALSATTVKVSGLPSGLKFTAKPVTTKVTSGTGASKVTTVVTNVPANTIYGAPTKASKTVKAKDGTVTVKPSEVKVTVTTTGKNKQVYQIDTTVDPLPSWAVGTFAGPSYGGGRGATALPGDEVVTNGVATVTVAASGKITAKQPVNGKATSFAAKYFDFYDAEDDSFWATLTAKVGKEVVTNGMVVSGHAGRMALPDGSDATVTNGVIHADRFDAWQYNWKDDRWKAIGKSFDKREYVYVVKADGSFSTSDEDVASPLGPGVIGKVTLKFSANGTAKVAGEFATYDAVGNVVVKNGKLVTVKASGSATLLPMVGEDDETRYLVFVYLAPKGLPPHARCLEVSGVSGQ